jgi:hypothetical protein
LPQVRKAPPPSEKDLFAEDAGITDEMAKAVPFDYDGHSMPLPAHICAGTGLGPSHTFDAPREMQANRSPQPMPCTAVQWSHGFALPQRREFCLSRQPAGGSPAACAGCAAFQGDVHKYGDVLKRLK